MPTHTLPLAPLAPLARRRAASPGLAAGGPAAARQAERLVIALGAALQAGLSSWTGSAGRIAPPVTGPAAPARPARPAALTPAGPAARAGLSPATRRRARLAALAVGAFLVPWSVMLSVTLPSAAQAHHWSMAWTGLDAAEALAALATAVLLARGDARASLTAVAGGALLVTDAWFDVCTSAPGLDHALSLAGAAGAELPLALAAFWLAARLMRGARPIGP